MDIVRTRAELAAWLSEHHQGLGFVPTMGNLHAGHLSLVASARAENATVGVSIFVNPTQFGPNEDLAKYPRTLEADMAQLRSAGCDLLFLPEASELYPPGFSTYVVPGQEAEPLCGAVRPGHFRGVCTIVALLFQLVRPARAYFGAKDWQQAMVLRRMVLDLAFPLEMVIEPTVREADGLAMSSRNNYLSEAERLQAPGLYRALHAAKEAFAAGEQDPEVLMTIARRVLAEEPALALQYLELREADSLELFTGPIGSGRAVLAAAAHLGKTRLIDNVLLGNVAPLLRTIGR